VTAMPRVAATDSRYHRLEGLFSTDNRTFTSMEFLDVTTLDANQVNTIVGWATHRAVGERVTGSLRWVCIL
jgi:hypothetical protein